MKQKGSYRVGTGASSLLMILVVLCLTALSVLSYVSASSELTVSRRAQGVTAQVYAAMDQGNTFLAELDAALLAVSPDESAQAAAETAAAALPYEGLTVEGDLVTLTLPATGRLSLQVAVRILPPGGKARYALERFDTVSLGGETLCLD